MTAVEWTMSLWQKERVRPWFGLSTQVANGGEGDGVHRHDGGVRVGERGMPCGAYRHLQDTGVD
eukprot:40636-Eustigmatos_ZCMA.PRE.1